MTAVHSNFAAFLSSLFFALSSPFSKSLFKGGMRVKAGREGGREGKRGGGDQGSHRLSVFLFLFLLLLSFVVCFFKSRLFLPIHFSSLFFFWVFSTVFSSLSIFPSPFIPPPSFFLLLKFLVLSLFHRLFRPLLSHTGQHVILLLLRRRPCRSCCLLLGLLPPGGWCWCWCCSGC